MKNIGGCRIKPVRFQNLTDVLTQKAKPKSIAVPAWSWASVSVEFVWIDLDILKM